MQIVYVLLPISLILASLGLLAFIWAIKNGQYKDLATPPELLVFEDSVDKEVKPKFNRKINSMEKEKSIK